MKIEIIREKLLEAVSSAEKVSGKHVALPILSLIMLEAKGDTLALKATNLDVGVEVTLPAKISEEGTLALSGSILKSFLANIKSKNVVCETEENILKIKTDEGEVSINTSSAEEFPMIPKIEGEKSWKIGSRDFVSGLNSVLWAASVSTIKPELSSVFVKEEADDLVFVATDSFRLAEKKIKSKTARGFDPILIPFKNALEIVRIFESYSGELDIVISKNQLSITTPTTHLSSRLVDGNFPDYRQIMPKEFETKATMLKQDLLQVLKLSSFFADTFNQIIISIMPSKKLMNISTKNNTVGESRQEIKAATEGESVTMPFNHRYVFDCLQSIDSESLVMKIAGAQKPLVISPASNSSFTYLIMPMNR
ncbi:MAG: DNA polymerase III subunit beta [Patescibacteria group bacterium]